MNWFEALILGIVQGLTEFLPVSSSGHLELGKVLMNVDVQEDITFTVVVHGATVLSTLVVFFKEVWEILKGSLKFKWNDETKYLVKIIISMIPVLIVGLFLEEYIEGFFGGRIQFVGLMLIITAILLSLTHFFAHRIGEKTINNKSALIMGIAQAFATLPGISRSGATIATGLLLGNKKKEVAQFSFLMVLIPILGANLMSLMDYDPVSIDSVVGSIPLLIGFLAAFISGWIACSWMVSIVKRGKLLWFAIYCLIVGLIAVISGFIV
ncbi:MAG: undecaprenyl-diphosphate phosphatase [Bacteroidetes bacterium]|jgi:undecaprenyl-diphosphatase|nr:undecaprenyl-diphosphate phosphatase [Bacteroidota bacterium]MBT4398283.1 undecaprenyl-diphosphate phosphatase [Bacteroidota bacterium]MBT4408892.1 undecaprenyl-diphosphate phosphatase [Bacteroidota bacterium]MBT7462445.1 undecaprenyl-diphosphate phosphatase [Bacteroidota bacterium]